MDAMELEYEDNSMDFCFTDPPYYDNIPYAADADFFYGWLKAALGDIFPDLFLTPETPKETEIIQDAFRHGGQQPAKDFYEKGMSRAFTEMYRVLKPEGLGIVVFAHKDYDAWETLLQAIYNSKLNIVSTWPMLMEAITRSNIGAGVSLNSVVILVCKKTPRQDQRYYDNKFRVDLEKTIREKLEQRWRQDFRGADFFLSALGPAIEAFSSYEAVLDVKTDEPILLKDYLQFVDKILLKFSLGKALDQEETSTDGVTQLYLVWRLAYQLALLPYDEVWKMTHALGLDEAQLEGKILKRTKKKSTILYKCLDALEKQETGVFNEKYAPNSLIETLQLAGVSWAEGDSATGDIVGDAEHKYGQEFWRVAQAICTLTPDAPETKLFSGLLQKYSSDRGKPVIKEKPRDGQQKFQIMDGKLTVGKEDM